MTSATVGDQSSEFRNFAPAAARPDPAPAVGALRTIT
jgi:hypothetical protein